MSWIKRLTQRRHNTVERNRLKTDADTASSPSHSPRHPGVPGERVIPCPTDWSLGTIYSRPPEDVWTGSDSYWVNWVGDGRGAVHVPNHQQVRLWASQRYADGTRRSPTDLTPLRGFEPDALDSLYVKDPTSDQLHNIEHLKGLRELMLDRPFSDDALAAARIGGLTKLRGLEIFYADVTDATVHPLLLGLPQIAYLSLPGTGVSDDTLRTAAELENLTAIKMARTGVTDDGVRALAQARRLLKVDLSETKVTDAGIRELASSGRLQRLTLDNTRITDEGLVHIPEARSLRYLSLHGTDITGSVLAMIGQLPDLISLQLSQTRIDDRALRDLHGMSGLQLLTLSDEYVTPSGLLALLESLPNLRYAWIGVTPFRSKESLEQLKERLRQAPVRTRSLRAKDWTPPQARDEPWSGTWKTIQLPAHAGSGDIRSIASTSSGQAWIANFGPFVADSKSTPSWRRPGWSPPEEGPCVLERTKGLAVGPDDTVWVAQDGELWRYNSVGWQRVIDPNQVIIGDVAVGPDGSAHAYRMTGTLYSIREGVTTSQQNASLTSIANCIAADVDGAVWIGTHCGVSRLKDGKWRNWKGSADGLPVVRDPGWDEFAWETRDWTPVTSIAIDPAGVTWISGSGGIARFSDGGWESYAAREELPYFFHSITTDDDGRVYATGGRNVATYIEGGWRIAEAPDHVLPAKCRLRAIDVRPDGIWVGAEGALLQFQPSSWD